MEDDTLLERCQQFASAPAEGYQHRDTIGLTEADLDSLHHRAVQFPTLWPLYHQVRTAHLADLIYLKEGQQRGWSITQIRDQLNRVESRTFTREGNQVQETTYFRFWPIARYIYRVRTSPKGHVAHEVEWAYDARVDLDANWEKYRPGFEEESLLMAQRFADHDSIKEMAFLPPEKVTYKVIFSNNIKRREFIFPTALRYENLLRNVALDHTFEKSEEDSDPESRWSLQRHSSIELGEGLTGLWTAVQEFDPSKVKHIPGYIEQRVIWHMGGQYDQRSHVVGGERLLTEARDYEAGSLDDPLPQEIEEDGESSLWDIVPDQSISPPDNNLLFSEIKNHFSDPRDRKILWYLAIWKDTQTEIAQELRMTQPAIAQRIKKIRAKVKKLLDL